MSNIDFLFNQSALFGNKATNRRSLYKLNNSIDLLELIKLTARNKNNWKEKDKLVLRLAFGARQKSDSLLQLEDLIESGQVNHTQQMFSQQDKDDPSEKYEGKKVSKLSKERPTLVHIFLNQLYNDPISPLHHGFTSCMRNTMKNTLLLDRGEKFADCFDESKFPPDDSLIKMMVNYTTSCGEFDGLVPKIGMFCPYPGGDDKEPPTLNQWKRTKEGNDYYKNRMETNHSTHENRNVGNSSYVFGMNMERLMNTSSTTSTSETQVRKLVGQVQVDTGAQIKNLQFTSDPNPENAFEIGLDTKLIEVVGKATIWELFDTNLFHRVFHIKNADGNSNYITYNKDDMTQYSIGALIELMEFPKGKVLKIVAEIVPLVTANQNDENSKQFSSTPF